MQGFSVLNTPPLRQFANTVSVIGQDQDWRVRILENGVEHLAFFTIEQHARSYADGQCLRMGLPLISLSTSVQA